MNTGNIIRDLRRVAGLTQKELGDLCGMADSAIRRYESGRGNPTEKTLKRIADALKVPVEALLSKESEAKHFADLDDMYYSGVVKWSEDQFFSAEETTAIKMHFAELMLRYKKMLEALASYKTNNPHLFDAGVKNANDGNTQLSVQELLEYHLAKELGANLADLKSWIDSIPYYFSNAVFENKNTAPGATNTESGDSDMDE